MPVITEIKGEQFGVRLQTRGYEGDPHISIQLLGEDDENWFTIGNPFSAFWLEDLIETLKEVKSYLEGSPDKFAKEQWGFYLRSFYLNEHKEDNHAI